ncbi:MAG TPA: 50S ribosomal protein L15 [Candidatus Kapabacteria bacterium]|jgi:large subunit ribosomal protein L15|nr:50S ribosomal protein L15 [Candidatus Kapabacteria bacterium]HOV92174.1 50S ribosomal protein L15 [Candidatus Kapabacteria bacterium]
MKHLGNIEVPKGARKTNKRLGRGQGSGKGGTSTRGNKGQLSRRGSHIPAFFEGGQMPLSRRVPKFGFQNPFRVEMQIVNLSRLQELYEENRLSSDDIIDTEKLYKLGVIKHKNKPVKILGEGNINFPLEIRADAFSNSAKEKIQSVGGKAIING